MLRIRLFLATVLAFTANMAAADTVTLDLQQTIDRALANDARISEKRAQVDVARGLLNEAQNSDALRFDANSFLGLAPRLRGGLFDGVDANGESFVGVPDDAYDLVGVTPWVYLQFNIIKPLYTFGKIEHYSAAAAGNIKVKEGDVEKQRAATILDASRAYYGYLAARDVHRLLDDALGRIQNATTLVEDGLASGEGNVSQSSLYALQTGASLIRRYIAEVEGLEKVAMAGLRLLAGVEKPDELQLADAHIEPVPLPQESLERLQAVALEKRPEMAQLRAGLDARRALVAARQSEKYPNLYAGVAGVLSYTSQRDGFDEANLYDPFHSAGVTPIIGLQWEWQSGSQPAKVQQAEAELQSTLALQAFAEKGIPFEVEEKYRRMQAQHGIVQELYEGSRSGRRWMISAYADFEAGVEEADKVVAAFQGYVLAHGDYLRAVNDYNLAVTQLRIATGELPCRDC
jgi:outer membrane protein TolC